MSSVQTLALTSAAAFLIYQLSKFLHSRLTSPLRHLNGPGHALNVDFTGLYAKDSILQQERWTDDYGHTFVFTGISGMRILVTTDRTAAAHILNDDALYPRNEGGQYLIRRILGNSFLLAAGDEHKRQKRFMSPAFGATQIREVTHVFIDAAIRLRDIWNEKLQESESGSTHVDVFQWMAVATLDGVGLAGFGYEFNGLKDHKSPPNVVAVAQRTLFTVGLQYKFLDAIKVLVPALSFWRTRTDRVLAEARSVIDRAGRELLANSKASLSGKEKVDLLSVFSKTKVQGEFLSEEEVLQQIPTILFAGHDTTSTSATWTFFFLATHPRVQSTLRSHLLRVKTDNPTMDELNSIDYLDSVVREALRLRAAAATITRTPSRDDTIPLSTPVKDTNGNEVNSVQVEKGLIILLPLHVINRSKELWGDDAREFRPERWDDAPASVKEVPGPWGNIATFGGGPHACIGYRFALIEIKSLVFTLIRSFELELSVPVEQVSPGFLQKPFLVNDPEKYQLPLTVRRLEAE